MILLPSGSPRRQAVGFNFFSIPSNPLQKLILSQNLDSEFIRLGQLAAGILAGDDKAGLFADAASGASAQVGDQPLDLLPLELLHRPRHHDGFAGQRRRSARCPFHFRIDSDAIQFGDRVPARVAVEKIVNRLRDHVADLVN